MSAIAGRGHWFGIVFVRNPYSRFVSLYEYAKRKGFARFCESFQTFADRLPLRIRKSRITKVHARKQIDFMTLKPNFLGRFEHITEDVASLEKILRIKLEMIHINRRKDGACWEDQYAGTNVMAFVRKFYALDVTLWKEVSAGRILGTSQSVVLNGPMLTRSSDVITDE